MTIKDYIKKQGLSGVDFAAIVGCSASALSLYHSGLRTPRPGIARRIVEATGGQVTYEDLYGRPALPNPTEQQEAAV